MGSRPSVSWISFGDVFFPCECDEIRSRRGAPFSPAMSIQPFRARAGDAGRAESPWGYPDNNRPSDRRRPLLGDGAVEGQSGQGRLFDCLATQLRQGAGQPEADRAGIEVGRGVAGPVGAVAESLVAAFSWTWISRPMTASYVSYRNSFQESSPLVNRNFQTAERIAASLQGGPMSCRPKSAAASLLKSGI